jgi:Trk K+ transport system NAD-binding subunit
LGLGNYGGSLATNLLERKKNVLGVDFDPQALDQWRERGLPVVYGDAGDPELLDQLPIDRTRWVVSTIRDREMNLTLLRILGNRKFTGRVAMAARDDEETETFRTAGADVLLRPFSDAAEQAADALTEAKYALPEEVDWLMALKETRLRPGSVFAGQPISRIPLRAETGVSILAVSRAGKVYLDVDPEFCVYPGDHIVLMGDPEGLKRAQDFLDQRILPEDGEELDQFDVAQIDVDSDSPLANRTLAELRFRQDHGLTVVGICRENDRIPIPKADQEILPGDQVIVLGKRESVEIFKQGFPSVRALQAACPVGESAGVTS